MDGSTKERLAVISFSVTGAALAELLKEKLQGRDVVLYGKYSEENRSETAEDIPVTCGIAVWAGERMADKDALLFIGAAGIAVRSIAPHIRNKLTDSPVLVMDELGKHIIPILSGHVGGANAIAREIADAIGAEPVITTATDLHGQFAVDVFARENHLRIGNKNGIAPVSSKVLREGSLTVSIEEELFPEQQLESIREGLGLASDPANRTMIRQIPYPPEVPVDILIAREDRKEFRTIFLSPKPYVLGIGCRKDNDAETVESFLLKQLKENGISLNEIRAAASIDIKKDEPGILAFCRKYRLPYLTYSAAELETAPGEFEESEFVKKTVGIGNVCGRAAAYACAQLCPEGTNPRTILAKQAGNGVTCAVCAWI